MKTLLFTSMLLAIILSATFNIAICSEEDNKVLTSNNEISLMEDVDFTIVGLYFFIEDIVSEMDERNITDFMKMGHFFETRYKRGEIPHAQFQHTERGRAAMLDVVNGVMLMGEEASKVTSLFTEFMELINNELITIQFMLRSSMSYEELELNIQTSIAIAIQNISNGGNSEGTVEELQFVYLVKNQWENILITNEVPPVSIEQYLIIAQQAANTALNLTPAPSPRSLSVSVFVLNSIMRIMYASEYCTENLDQFIYNVNQSLVSVYSAFDDAMVNSRSLKKIEASVRMESSKVLNELVKCKAVSDDL